MRPEEKKITDNEFIINLISTIEDSIGEKVVVFGASNRKLVEELLRQEKKIVLLDIRESAFDKFSSLDVEMKLVEEGQEFRGISKCDTIIFFDTLHHVKDKYRKIKECAKILNDGGTIILYEPNIYTKFVREYDQFGTLKDSMYKLTLIGFLEMAMFKVDLLSSESIFSRNRIFKKLIVAMQRTKYDPIFRILLVAKKTV